MRSRKNLGDPWRWSNTPAAYKYLSPRAHNCAGCELNHVQNYLENMKFLHRMLIMANDVRLQSTNKSVPRTLCHLMKLMQNVWLTDRQCDDREVIPHVAEDTKLVSFQLPHRPHILLSNQKLFFYSQVKDESRIAILRIKSKVIVTILVICTEFVWNAWNCINTVMYWPVLYKVTYMI